MHILQKFREGEPEEMVQQLRLVPLAEDSSLAPELHGSSQLSLRNYSSREPNTPFWPPQDQGLHRVHEHTCGPNSLTRKFFAIECREDLPLSLNVWDLTEMAMLASMELRLWRRSREEVPDAAPDQQLCGCYLTLWPIEQICQILNREGEKAKPALIGY